MSRNDQSIRILFVEDLPADVEMARREIKKGKIEFVSRVTDTEPEFRNLLDEFDPDIIVSDYSMPSFDGMTALEITLKMRPGTPFVMLTGSMNEETAVACMKAGATDYVIKEQIKRLPFAVRDAIEKSRSWQEKEIMQKQLRESEGMYRSLIENSREGIYLMYERNFELINPEFQRMFGYSLEELRRDNFDLINLIAPESLPFIKERIRKLDAGEQVSSRYEFTALTKDGEKKEVEASVSYIKFRDGIATQGIIRDVTERKQAEKQLKESEARFRLIFDNVKHIAVQGYLKDGTVHYWNKASEELYGYSANEAIGKNLFDLIIPEEMISAAKVQVAEMFETDRAIPAEELLLKRKDGSKVPVYSNHTIVNILGLRKEMYCIDVDLTKQKEAQNKLEKSIQFANAVANSTPVLIFIWDVNKQENVWSNNHHKEFFKTIHRSKRNLDFTDLQELIHEDDLNEFVEKSNALLNQKHFERFTTEMRVKKDDEWRWMSFNISVFLRDDNGEIFQIIGAMTDIDERKQAVEELKYNSALTQMLMELSYNFINLPLSDVNDAINNSLARMGEFVDADRSYIFEYDFEKRLTSNTFEWCREGVDSQIDNLQNVPMEFVPDWVKRHQKGEIIFIENVADLEDKSMRDMLEPQGIKSTLTIPLIKDNNQCIGFVGFDFVRKNYSYTNSEEQLLKVFAQMLLNVEQRKLLETNRAKLAKAIEESPTSTIITDKNGNIEYVNPKTLEISGYNKKELLGKNMRIFKSGFHDNNFYASLWNSILKGDNWYGEMINRKKNGTSYWVDISISPLFDDDGKIAHFVSVREDITEKKKMVVELIKSKEKAEESDRLKSAFLANMSHEIRTPMNGILGFTDLLKEPMLSGDEKNQYIDIIQKSGQRMLNTINDLIEISKIESGTMKVDYSNVDMNETVDFFFSFFKPEVENKRLKLTGNKDQPHKKAVLKTDKEKLNAIITNLVKNAVKYTSSGTIEFGYRYLDAGVEFYVKDSGIGIEEDRLEAVFDRFVQADNSFTKPYEGAGLGLAITRAYVEMLGGNIWVNSEIGKGSEFVFFIPHPENENKTENNSGLKIDYSQVNEKLKNINVLVAEDDEVARLYLAELLNGKCKHIWLASTGLEAVELYDKNPGIDLILMDMKMPVMDGYKATEKIKKMNPDALIIAQTAYALSGDSEKALAVGCDDYLTKPLKKENLLKLIDKYF